MTRSALAIDHGNRRTGFAVADPLRIVTQPLDRFEGDQRADLLDHIADMLEERDVDVFVIGLPFNMDGSEGPRAAEVRAFGQELKQRFPRIAVAYQDERLSTKAAEELLREQGITGEARKRYRDSASAMVILRDWIEAGEPRE